MISVATDIAKLVNLRWRLDRIPLLLYLLTFIVMSYPFVFQMHDHLPMDNIDTHTALWQNWWMREALSSEQNVVDSDLLFYPTGLDLTLQPRRWSTFPLWTLLYSMFGDPFAFNLTAMLGILFKAYGMYLFGMRLFNSKIPAWVCGGFYAFSAPALALSLQQPNTGATEWIPWFMLALSYGLSRIRQGVRGRTLVLLMIIAGLLFAINAYANLKIGILAMMLGGSYIALQMLASRLWHKRKFWLSMLVFSVSAIGFVAPLIIPVLRSENFSSAIEQEIRGGKFSGVDLLSFVKSDHSRPLLYMQSIAQMGGERLSSSFIARHLSNVGVVSIAFAFAGVIYAARRDRHVYVWLAIAIVFWLLSLGVRIYFNAEYVELIYWTPYRLAQDVFFFRIIKQPFRMILIFLFAFSILIAYGLHYKLLTADQSARQRMLMVVSIVLLFFGTSIFPIPLRTAPRPQYLSALESLPDGAIIDVPMGRQPSKYYMSVQRFHRRPIVEGMIARMPDGSYDYATSNTLLAMLHPELFSESLSDATHDDWLSALRDLQRDGFRYLVFHRQVPMAFSKSEFIPEWINTHFIMPDPVYEDDNVTIYDIAMWDGPFPTSRDGFSYTDFPGTSDLDLRVGDSIRLLNWSLLDANDVEPCQSVRIESWWQLMTEDDTPYTLKLVLASEIADRQLTAVDKVPADRFTTEWKPNRYYRDRTTLEIPCELGTGQYPLLLGMKESMTGESLEISYPDGNTIGTLYYLTTLYVQNN